MAVRKGRQPGSFTVEFQQGGQRVFERLPAGITKAQAQERETQLRRQIFDGLLGRREVTIAEGIGSWLLAGSRKNRKQAESEARQWEPWAGRLLREAPEVAGEACRAWAKDRASTRTIANKCADAGSRGRRGAEAGRPMMDGRLVTALPNGWPPETQGKLTSRGPSGKKATAPTPATINRRLALLKAVCKHVWKQGQIGENLSGRITLLREDNKREVYLTREEVQRLAGFAPGPTCRAAIIICAYTGLRASELLALQKTDSRSTTIRLARTKSGKPRIVPVPTPIRGLLGELPLGLSYWQLHKQFLRAKRAAKMPHVKFHDLRHTCASWLINAGVDLYTVGKILGHSGPATTARYAHLSTQTLEKAMGRLK